MAEVTNAKAAVFNLFNIIVGVVSHDKNIHDSKTLDTAITHANSNRTKPIQQAVCDRGYVGVKEVLISKTAFYPVP
jgi:hypothetical protein